MVFPERSKPKPSWLIAVGMAKVAFGPREDVPQPEPVLVVLVALVLVAVMVVVALVPAVAAVEAVADTIAPLHLPLEPEEVPAALVPVEALVHTPFYWPS